VVAAGQAAASVQGAHFQNLIKTNKFIENVNSLKGHSHKNVCEIIPLNNRFGPN
jgi:hypothetical protein